MSTVYCTTDDVAVGDITLPRHLGAPAVAKQKAIENAADEIAAAIGRVYKLPYNPSPDTSEHLLLKKVNWYIATGRLVAAAAANASDDQMNAFAMYHLREAQKVLDAIVSGEIKLRGADDLEKTDKELKLTTSPIVGNVYEEDTAIGRVTQFYGSW